MTLAAQVWSEIGGEPWALERLLDPPRPTGALPSSFQVERFGAAAMAAVGLAMAELAGAESVQVDPAGVAQALRSEQALRVAGEAPPALWDPLSRIYPAADGWIRLHGNYAQHREAIDDALGTHDPAEVARVVAQASATEIELRIHEAGGAAAAAHTLAEWDEHPHGAQVRDRPLVQTIDRDDHAARPWRPSPFRTPGTPPLTGLRVLELTRVIAGPVAGRTLAWFGADVLRIESPDHEELTTVVVDTGPGKRSALLDLRTRHGRHEFETLLAGADVFLHGLRPGALAGLGLDAGARAELAPGLVDAAISAYGPGPWSGRRGFDSLMQLSSGLGLAEAEAAGSAAGGPRPLPCQVLDHTTGLLTAAAIIRAVAARIEDGRRRSITASLARTAAALADAGQGRFDGTTPAPAEAGSLELRGSFGVTRQVPVPVTVDGLAAGWRAGTHAPGADAPTWHQEA